MTSIKLLNELEAQYERESKAWHYYHSASAGSGVTALLSHAEFEHRQTADLYHKLVRHSARQAKTFCEMHPNWTP